MSHAIFQRAQRHLNFADYRHFIPPLDCGVVNVVPPTERQYILRMMVRRPGDADYTIPDSLRWLEGTIRECGERQRVNGFDPIHDFTYITVRNGIVTSETDDVLHVDGFSMMLRHRPEQNYFYSDAYATEILAHGFTIPDDFDYARHNLHFYFQDHADESKIYQLPERRLFLLDPYVVHRRPKISDTRHRTFFRISFIPIEIIDDTSTPNPLFPVKVYNRDGLKDMRDKLVRYPEKT